MATKKKTTKKPVAKKKATKQVRRVAEKLPVKKQQTYEVKFTKMELIHLRDLFGVYLPPQGDTTVSSALAAAEGRTVVETILFEKVVQLCQRAGLPTQETAPDFIVGLAANPTLGVFPMSVNETEEEESPEEVDEPEDVEEDESDWLYGD